MTRLGSAAARHLDAQFAATSRTLVSTNFHQPCETNRKCSFPNSENCFFLPGSYQHASKLPVDPPESEKENAKSHSSFTYQLTNFRRIESYKFSLFKHFFTYLCKHVIDIGNVPKYRVWPISALPHIDNSVLSTKILFPILKSKPNIQVLKNKNQ